MPTGYTASVATGEVTEFAEYAMQCARAFGACIMLRDEPMSSEIPEFTPSDHNAKALDKAERELAEFAAMTSDERRLLYEEETKQRIARANEGIEAQQKQRDRYEAMLEKAKAFKAPTADHQNYAAFLVSQLEESIKFDCSGDYYQKELQPVSFDQWQSQKRAGLIRDLAYHEKANREEIERTASRNEWVKALRESLAETVSV